MMTQNVVQAIAAVLFASSMAFAQPPTLGIHKDLLVWMPLTNGAVTNVVTGGAAVTVVGTKAFEDNTPTPNEQAASFSGSTWHISCGVLPCVRYGSFTVGLWLNTHEVMPTEAAFLGNKDWATSANLGFCLIANRMWPVPSTGATGRSLSWNVKSSDSSCTGDLYGWYAQDTWRYVTLVFDRENDAVSVYVNGELFGAKPFNAGGKMPLASLDFGSLPLTFGTSGGVVSSWRGRSSQDEITVWSRALSAEDVAQLYAKSGVIPSLISGKGATFIGHNKVRLECALMRITESASFNCGIVSGLTDGGNNINAWDFNVQTGTNVTGVTASDIDLPADFEDRLYYRWYIVEKGQVTLEPVTQEFRLNEASSLHRGLRVYLPFNSSSCANAVNGAGVSVVGTETYDTAAPTPGECAAAFSGSTWHIDCGVLDFVRYGSFTVSLWAKMCEPMPTDAAFLGNKNWTSSANLGFCLIANRMWPVPSTGATGRSLSWNVKQDDTNATGDFYGWYEPDVWRYVTLVFDRGADLVTAYTNGIVVGTRKFNVNNTIDLSTFDFGALPLTFGTSGGVVDKTRGRSYMDEIAVWDRALSADEVSYLMLQEGHLQPYIKTAEVRIEKERVILEGATVNAFTPFTYGICYGQTSGSGEDFDTWEHVVTLGTDTMTIQPYTLPITCGTPIHYRWWIRDANGKRMGSPETLFDNAWPMLKDLRLTTTPGELEVFCAQNGSDSRICWSSESSDLLTQSISMIRDNDAWYAKLQSLPAGRIWLQLAAENPLGVLKSEVFSIVMPEAEAYSRIVTSLPANASGMCRAWLDANDLSGNGTAPSQGLVADWTDKSGNGTHAANTPTASSRPAWRSSAFGGRGGLVFERERVTKLDFTPTRTWSYFTDMTTSQQTWFVTTSLKSYYYGAAALNAEKGFCQAGLIAESSGGWYGLYAHQTGFRTGCDGTAGKTVDAMTDWPLNTPALLEWSLNPAVANPIQLLALGAGRKAASGVNNLPKSGMWATPVSIGRGWAAAGAYDGEVGEIVAYAGALTEEDAKTVRRYLARKWLGDSNADALPDAFALLRGLDPFSASDADADELAMLSGATLFNVNVATAGVSDETFSPPVQSARFGDRLVLTVHSTPSFDFIGWSDGVMSPTRIVSVFGDATYTANFAPVGTTVIVK